MRITSEERVNLALQVLAKAPRNHSAYNEVYTYKYTKLYGQAITYVKRREDAEDIVHNLFLVLPDIARKIKFFKNCCHYLSKAIRYASISWLRRRNRTINVDFYDEEACNSLKQYFITHSNTPEDAAILKEFIESLSKVARAVLLELYRGSNSKEISKTLNLPYRKTLELVQHIRDMLEHFDKEQ